MLRGVKDVDRHDGADIARRVVEVKLERLALKEERIRSAYENGIDSLEEYRTRKKQLVKERAELEAELASWNQQTALLPHRLKSFWNVSKQSTISSAPLMWTLKQRGRLFAAF